MGFREYIEALEEERRKIQVFPKELPLSLELVTQGNTLKQRHIRTPFCDVNLKFLAFGSGGGVLIFNIFLTRVLNLFVYVNSMQQLRGVGSNYLERLRSTI